MLFAKSRLLLIFFLLSFTFPVQVTSCVIFSDFPDNPAWVAGGHAVGWDVLNHDAASTNDGVVTDRDARHHPDSPADPDIVANSDRVGIFHAGISSFRVKRVTGSVEATVRTDKNIVAKGHPACIQDSQVVVGVEVVANLDIPAIVAPEVWFDLAVFTALTQDLF